MQTEDDGDGRPRGPIQRVTAVASVVATLDQRIVDLFEALEELRTSAGSVSQLSDDAAELMADLRARMDRLEAKLRIDSDELKNAVLAKLDDVDIENFGERMSGVEKAIFSIEAAVTRLDRLVSGMVDSVPDFITRRVKSRSVQAADELE